MLSSLHSTRPLSNRCFHAFVFTETLSGLLRSGRRTVRFSGAPLHSAGVGQRVPPSPDSELRVQQHHWGYNNNPTQKALPGRRDTAREDGEWGRVTTGQDRSWGLQGVQGAERLAGPTAPMGTGGNEANGNPEARRAEDSCRSETARWVLTLQSAGSERMPEGCCADGGVVNCVMNDLWMGRKRSHQGNSSLVLVCMGVASLQFLCSSEMRTSLEVWENQPKMCGSLQRIRRAEKNLSCCLNVVVLVTGKAVCGDPSGAVQSGQQTHRGREGPGVWVLGLVRMGSHRQRWWWMWTWCWEDRRLKGWLGHRWGRRGQGAPEFLSETGPGGAGVGEVSCDHPVTLSVADHVADLPVELQQLGADQAEVLAGTHQSDGAGLAQSLMAEVDVHQRLDLALWAATKHSRGPLPPGIRVKEHQWRGSRLAAWRTWKIWTHDRLSVSSIICWLTGTLGCSAQPWWARGLWGTPGQTAQLPPRWRSWVQPWQLPGCCGARAPGWWLRLSRPPAGWSSALTAPETCSEAAGWTAQCKFSHLLWALYYWEKQIWSKFFLQKFNFLYSRNG